MRRIGMLLVIVMLSCETKEHADQELGALKKAKDAVSAVSARANGTELQELGIPECDAYVRNYESCLSQKVPEDRRTSFRTTLNKQRNKWQTAVTSGEDNTRIGDECKAAVTTASQAMSEFGCTW